jgi:ribose transport system permease protein
MTQSFKALLRPLSGYGQGLTVLVVLWAVFAATTPALRGEGGVYAVLTSFSLLGLCALGLAITMIAGELDLSVGSMAAVAGVVAIQVADAGLIAAVAAACFVAALIGTIQGYVIARLGLNSLVLTIGTLILLRGLAGILSDDKTVLLDDLATSDPLLERWWIFAPDSVLAFAVFAIIGVVLTSTRFGREIRAVGGGRSEAAAAGVPTGRPLVLAFTLSAACAGLAGALASLKGGSASPISHGELLLSAVAAALVGGIGLHGGRGSVVNVAIGVAVLAALAVGLTARGAQAYTTQLATGGLLLAVVALEFGLQRVRQRRTATGHAPTIGDIQPAKEVAT